MLLLKASLERQQDPSGGFERYPLKTLQDGAEPRASPGLR